MAETAAVQPLLDAKEQPIFDKVLGIRENLSVLKRDKSTYIKSQDVVNLYEQLIEQVHLLNNTRVDKRTEQNAVDRALDDCFQLISLFFMTIGRNNEAPAVYAITSTIKRLGDHLIETKGLYSAKDLEHVTKTLEKMRVIVERSKTQYSPHLVTLLEARLDACSEIISNLQRFLSTLSPELAPLQEKLISILRSISAANTRSTARAFPLSEVKELQAQLKEIQNSKVDGKFVLPDGQVPEGGQDVVSDLLERTTIWADTVLARQGQIDEAFRQTFDGLCTIRNKLESISLTQAWSLRETDLFSFQRELDKYDESRVKGNFVNSDGKPADLFTERTLLYLLRKSYASIYFLLISSEPVSEALLPIFNQLQTLRRCLLEVKKSGGVSSPRELYPYSMKLASIDNMKVDGKFMVGSDIPEGQGSVAALLAECFELNYELRVEAEEAHQETEVSV
ncbi:MAG: hypothetical protein M1829_006913 [Trizodia sp. TS-e1964]|nr:MAG: hypothetical protein M1829_006913 [Trizodia sp. TS-e1964]